MRMDKNFKQIQRSNDSNNDTNNNNYNNNKQIK